MAANLQSRGLVSLGKRVVNQISYASARTTATSSSLSARRSCFPLSISGSECSKCRRWIRCEHQPKASWGSAIAKHCGITVQATYGWRTTYGLFSQKKKKKKKKGCWRGVQTSVYDKNPEDHVRDSFVPDEVIEAKSDKYWAPHPQTGVFGPAATDTAGVERGFHSSPATAESILEQKAFFRPLEDLDKPMPN